ncbi:hypothetical protein CLOLEP_03458 [[Clostridium] leptum DSM 753]|uniref:Uncharacterized protein n=1 Tax=[Clostridium] leptum DSM 753 TaxID=428125 RepID=A7VXY2_9FIRM|nr:hypothetical protein CLOLEP_03458 [[Clostridium] leptum DSM 753]
MPDLSRRDGSLKKHHIDFCTPPPAIEQSFTPNWG